MLIVQMRHAEVALADGRLDEAYRLVQSDSLRSHRRGQSLVSRLVKKLIERAQSHLSNDNPQQALIDCEKAQALGGNRPDVVALRSQIEQAIIVNERFRRDGARVGMLETAAKLVDSALAREDLDRATSELIRARGNGCDDHRLRALDGNVRTMLRTQIETALNTGRLDQAQPLVHRLSRLDPNGLTTQQLHRAVEQMSAASAAIDAGHPTEAREIFARVIAQLPNAKWAREVLDHVTAAEQSLQKIRTGPLGLLTMDASQPEPRPTKLSRPVPGPVALPTKFILQVDGAGSYLILRKSIVTIGPISSSQSSDIALIAEPGAAIVSIERAEDDYFVRGASGIKLLASGDRISLSPRCTMSFALPNPSSATAALDLISGRFPRADIRRVILLDRDLIIGSGATSHVRAEHLTDSIVIHTQNERLFCNGLPIELGVPTRFGGVSFTVTA